MSLSRRQRLRRVGILCCHILRNLAYYLAWFGKGKPGTDSQFWVSVNGNFADVTMLEWCKALADVRGKVSTNSHGNAEARGAHFRQKG